jgi:hypothetical protein
VPSQLKTFTPVGIAISMVEREKKELAIGPIPTVNMWCAQTLADRKAIATEASTIAA